MAKRKPMLFQRVEQEKAERKQQEVLHEKYHIDQPDTVVVEKSNMVKWSIRTVGAIVRTLATILLCCLASIGLTALVYESTRLELVRVLTESIRNLQQLIGL